ncbi:MAG: hypothetical protein IPJ82_07160 [Lewinellaceae bacterium]|nr:hypothetical protein [Lewinellaceae bacterium]
MPSPVQFVYAFAEKDRAFYLELRNHLPKDGSPIQSPENTGAFKEIGDEVRKILQQKLPSPGKSKPVMTIDDLEDSLKQKLGGQYRDFAPLKQGHLVTVFKATDYYLKRDVVIKAINPWIEIEEDIRHNYLTPQV